MSDRHSHRYSLGFDEILAVLIAFSSFGLIFWFSTTRLQQSDRNAESPLNSLMAAPSAPGTPTAQPRRVVDVFNETAPTPKPTAQAATPPAPPAPGSQATGEPSGGFLEEVLAPFAAPTSPEATATESPSPMAPTSPEATATESPSPMAPTSPEATATESPSPMAPTSPEATATESPSPMPQVQPPENPTPSPTETAPPTGEGSAR
ncbi:hypothetical protein JJD41_02795 [Oxynema sp. CENA135]|uniref:hypothetical protein n=1 Tax=Oxynema sp. CENA135 TaxID=984206 RepID=UPI00190C9393|nr:hypothetical protein [Oxynema sp. CENA135]MBK4728819.1 hypothetical protein [Oxynema sp. CENA135]